MPSQNKWFFPALFLVVFAFRACHAGILWPDEDYHIAAALQMLGGKILYRDLWYDKPPLNALFYAAFDAPAGWPLRLLGAAFVTAACILIYLIARELWGRREGVLAALLLAFYLTFDLPSAVIPMAADFLMLGPHLCAIWLAIRRRPFLAGLACGVAMLLNVKAVLVLACCAVLCFRNAGALGVGFLLPNFAALAILGHAGAVAASIQQVWTWGLLYARDTPIAHPVWNILQRTLNWMGFHVLLVIAAVWFWWRDRSGNTRWLAIWAAVSLAGVLVGGRMFPRYFLQFLPAAVIAGARGLMLLRTAPRLLKLALLIALLVPVVRFGPRYGLLIEHRAWKDIVLDQDSRTAADWILEGKGPSDSLFVWGYRPDLFVYTRMPAGSRFWDSQPLTGVPADRHLFDARPIAPEWAAQNRREFAQSFPTFVADSLSVANPKLAIGNYPELRDWFGHYDLVAETNLTKIYLKTR